MKEILFRGKRKDNNEWVYGWLFQLKYATRKYLIRTFPNEDDEYRDYVVEPETIGQYTGLEDKIGTKIFEGDILLSDYECENETRSKDYIEVECGHWSCGCCYLVYGHKFDNFHIAPQRNIKGDRTNVLTAYVVGNIYENKELIDEDKR